MVSVLFCCSCLVFIGCANAPLQRPLADEPIAEMIPADEVGQPIRLQVAHYAPRTDHCGPAAVRSVLAYYSSVDESVTVPTLDELAGDMMLPKLKGSWQVGVTSTLREYGLVPYELTPSKAALEQSLVAGQPLIVLQNLGFRWWPKWHYAVVVGFDNAKQRVLLHSADQAYYDVPWRLFEKTWRRGGRWALAAVPPHQMPQGVAIEAQISALADLASAGFKHDAAVGLAKARQVAAQAPLVWFASGNAKFAERAFAEAIDFYQQALALDGAYLPAMNNLAYAYQQVGEQEKAEAMIKQAVQLAPSNVEVNDSYQEIVSRASESMAPSVAPSGNQ